MVITAIPAGFAAGLFGIGGGLITVPILFYIFGAAGIEPAYLMHLAVGTSFGIIIPTSIVSVLTHQLEGPQMHRCALRARPGPHSRYASRGSSFR